MFLNTARATALLQAEGVDGVIAATLENNYYLTGVWVLGQEMFPRDDEFYTVITAAAPEAGVIVSSIGEADLTLSAYPSIRDVVTFGTFFRDTVPDVPLDADEQRILDLTTVHQTGRSSLEAIAEAITTLGLSESVVAVDERGPKATLLAELAERFPRATFRPAAALLRRIRAVKTAREHELLTGALRATEAGFRAALELFADGVTEREVKAAFDQAVTAEGARPGFCLVRFGKGLALGQVAAGDTPLRPGDFAFFDIGVDFQGYKSDIGRLVSFGEPSAQTRALFDASKAGQQLAIDLMKPGAVARDVFNAAVERVREAGIPTYQRQHVGHGIGIEYYDMPVLTPGADTVLEEGMVFEVETPYYRLGVGGAFIEDTVIITGDGAQIITELDRDLIVVEPR
ncbi:M24 family metallopeptidase [Dactylosporangium sp. CA-092794]|uniref:M24 family metallopeptidase n=1 Tax=Dactylosporangium sp. CA-092794 TaxID=3239929 RepID=UPI003D8E1039